MNDGDGDVSGPGTGTGRRPVSPTTSPSPPPSGRGQGRTCCINGNVLEESDRLRLHGASDFLSFLLPPLASTVLPASRHKRGKAVMVGSGHEALQAHGRHEKSNTTFSPLPGHFACEMEK